MALISFATNPNKHTNIDTLTTTSAGDGANGSAGPGHQAGTGTASDTHTGSDTTTGSSGDSGHSSCHPDTDGNAGNADDPDDPGNEGNAECDGQESLLDQLHDISGLLTNTTGNRASTSTSTGLSSGGESRAPDTAQSGPPPQEPQPPKPHAVQQQAAPPSPEPDPYSDPEPTPEPEPDAETATETQTAPDPEPEPEPARPIPPPLINGWRRRIEPWEIPPRPPQAPENALPPVYDGDTWFWFGPTPPGTPAFAPQPMPKPTATATATESEPRGEPGVHPGAPSPPPSPEPPPEQNYGFGPEWDSTPLTNTRGNSSYSGTSSSASASDSLNSHDDCDGAPEDDTDKPWPHSVYGVDVSAPGDNETLPGLDPIDPFSSDPAVKDTRTNGQKLLEGLISCVKLAARTGKLPSTAD
ncbi:hypothetical protein NHF46_04350 [Arthrobacter alpinus]|nr:hypothetical protein [Arthrobacter alpinus]